MKMVRPVFACTFFAHQILDLDTGEMIWPVDYDVFPLRYPEAAYHSPERKVQTPRINGVRRQLEIYKSGIFDFTPLFQQGLKLDAAEHEPLFLTPEQFYSFSFHEDVFDRAFRFYEYVENDLDAEEILHAYKQNWDNMVLDFWARKHGIELLPNPDLESVEAHEEDLAWRRRMAEEHPNINLDYPLTVDQDEVNRFPDVFVSQMPRPSSN